MNIRVALAALLLTAGTALPLGAQESQPLSERFGTPPAPPQTSAPSQTPPVSGLRPTIPLQQTPPPQRLLPFPSMTPTPSETAPSQANGIEDAYGAFQRGYYLSAQRIAEPLANLGDAHAQALLGELNLRGLGVPRDEAEAARWYRVASETGLPEAQFRYAMMLIEGVGVPIDIAAARELMQKAADGGNPLAAFNYGQMLLQESPTGGFEAASGYFRVAAEAGIADGQYALAQLYAFGRGVPAADDAQALRLLNEAAVKGHETAQIELGIWMINGRGAAADPQAGFRWLKGAAERGNPIAQNRIAHLYKDGIGTDRDTAEAAKWVVLARRSQNADAALDTFFRALPPEEQQRALEAANRVGLS